MKEIYYGSILERDEVLSRSIVESVIPEDRRDAFAKLLSSGKSISDVYLSKHRVGFIYNCASIFATWDINDNSLNYVQISRMVNLLNYRDSIKLYAAASKEIQSHVGQMRYVNSSTLNAYLRSIIRLNVEKLRYMGNNNYIRKREFPKYGEIKATKEITLLCVNKIKETICFSNKDKNLDALDLSKMKKFNDWIMTRYRIFDDLGDLIVPILVMWKAIYGEKNVIECLGRFSEENIMVTADSLMEILDHWTELSAYPASWIVETGEYKIIE